MKTRNRSKIRDEELVQRLVEYQRFKSVAETFAELDLVRMGMWSRAAAPPPGIVELRRST